MDSCECANATLPAPPAKYGNPDIRPIPPAGDPYIAALMQQPGMAQVMQTPGVELKCIEIDKLLAYQMHVYLSRSEFYCNTLSSPPTLDEMLKLCLPIAPPQETFEAFRQPQSLIIRTRSLNLQVQLQGMLAPDAAGVGFGVSLPFVHVTRFNGRCYLHNGYHRTYGARKAGAQYIPALLRDAATAQEAGIRDDGSTFGLALLESTNPPTFEKFIDGTAQRLSLKTFRRLITVAWGDHIVPDE